MEINPCLIQEQTTKEEVQYYERLRKLSEMKSMAYWIGNPAVQIISGIIQLEPLRPIPKQKQPESYQEYLHQLKQANQMAISPPSKHQTHFPDRLDIQTHPQSPHKIRAHSVQEVHSAQVLRYGHEAQSLNEKLKHQGQQDKQQKSDQETNKSNKEYNPSIKGRCLVLCGIPNSKSAIQVLQTSQIRQNWDIIKQIIIIKTQDIQTYSILIIFPSYKETNLFFNQLFTKQYNHIEIDRIILRLMRNITVNINQINKNIYTHQLNLFKKYFHTDKSLSLFKSNLNSQFDHPICAICQEQINCTIISILCGHHFHWDCLSKWQGNTCPLCRYHQQPPVIKFCDLCNQCQGLWVCLICGVKLCCGNDDNILSPDSHIYSHYLQAGHSLSMQLQTKFLFDAKIPAFLHQVFYKDILKPGEEEKIMREEIQQDRVKKDKITEKIKEYENQVSDQMHSQRLYFLKMLAMEAKKHRTALQNKEAVIAERESELKSLDQQLSQLEITLKSEAQQAQQLETKLKKMVELRKQLNSQTELKRQKVKKAQLLEKQQLALLEEQIKQKKEELQNYHQNLKISEKLKQKLKNDKVVSEVMLEGKKRQKR